MKAAGNAIAIVAAMSIAACSGSGDDRVRPAPADPDEMAAGTTTRFDGEVLRIEVTRGNGQREEFSAVRDEFYNRTWTPFLPDHSGRRLVLAKSHTEGISLAYVVFSWDNSDPANYLAAGYWLHDPEASHPWRTSLARSETGMFVDGPEFDSFDPAVLRVAGTATYVTPVGGLFNYRYGSDWPDSGETEITEEFAGTITLTADFDDGTVSGCIGCIGDIEITREHLYAVLGWRRTEPLVQPADYELHFGTTSISANGTFENTDVQVRHPERTVSESGGHWSDRFSNIAGPNGNPRLVAGTGDAQFRESDGSEGRFQSSYLAVDPSIYGEQAGDSR